MEWQLRMSVTIALFSLPLYMFVFWQWGTALNKIKILGKRTIILFNILIFLWFYSYPIYIFFTRHKSAFDLFMYNKDIHILDYLLQYPFWWGLISIIEIFLAFLVILLISGIIRLAPFSFKDWWKKNLPKIKVSIFIFIFLFTFVNIYFHSTQVSTSKYPIKINQNYRKLSGLKILFLTDMHINRYNKKIKKVKDKIRNLSPDLILFTGDINSYKYRFLPECREFLKNIQAKDHKISCLGDHDHWSFGRGFKKMLKEHQWDLLEDEHLIYYYNKKKILLTGITNIYSQRISESKLENLLKDTPPADFKILFVHQPHEHIIKAAQKYGYNLCLGGHTHGGQLVFHLLGLPLNQSLLETPYYKGRYKLNNLEVIISNGVGTTLAPFRYFAKSEICLLEFK